MRSFATTAMPISNTEGEEAGKARGEVLVHREIPVAHVEGERQDAET